MSKESLERSRPILAFPGEWRGGVRELFVSKFRTGTLVFTKGVNDKVANDEAFAIFVTNGLKRHCSCDWGDLCKDDKKENEFALDKHLRLFSAYEHKTLPKIWIITEADRSVTTVLFPDEY